MDASQITQLEGLGFTVSVAQSRSYFVEKDDTTLYISEDDHDSAQAVIDVTTNPPTPPAG